MQHPKKESNEGKEWERQNPTIIALKNDLFLFLIVSLTHRIHGAAIYGNIYHKYTPFMLVYIPAPWIRHGL